MPPGARLRTLALFALMLLSVGGCKQAEQPARFFGTDRPSHPPRTLFFNNGAEPQSLDPGRVFDGPGTELVRQLFEGLTRYDPKTLAPLPGMASSWETSEDGLTWTFHLRAAQWSDGRAVTATDFAYAWTRVLDPLTGAQYANMLWVIRNGEAYTRGKLRDPAQLGIRARDEKTLVVTLQYPAPWFLELTAYSPFMPLRRDVVERFGERWTRPEHMVSNGAFKLQSWRLRYEMVLVKNPTYWDAANVRLEKVVAMAVEDGRAALRLYQTGTLDWMGSNAQVPPESEPFVRGFEDFVSAPRLGVYFLWLQTQKPPLDDLRVRQALSLAIDRQRIVQFVLKGGQRALDHLVPDALLHESTGYRSPKGLGFDPERARALLAEAGYPGGRGLPPLTYHYNTDESHRQIAEAVQAMWREHLGVRVQLYNMEYKVHLDRRKQGDFQIARGGWWADYADPSTFLELFRPGSTQNDARWNDEGYGQLLEAALRAPSATERNRLYAEAEARVIADSPMLPIYVYAYSDFVKPYVKGIHPNNRHLHPLRSVWVEHPDDPDPALRPGGGGP
jgi:oligopeptide transport system substrate-binding protein